MTQSILMSFKTLILTSTLLISTAVFAEKGDGNGHGKHNQEGFLQKMKSELNLTEEQITKLKEINKNSGANMKASREAMKAARENLEKALSSSASESEIKAKYDELEKLQQQNAKARFDKVLAIRAVLTPEQREKFKAHMGEGFGGRKEGKGRGMGGGKRKGMGQNRE